MKKRDRVVLNQCPTWWNVETRNGGLLFSSDFKMVARHFQRIANHKSFEIVTLGHMDAMMSQYGRWLAKNNIEVT